MWRKNRRRAGHLQTIGVAVLVGVKRGRRNGAQYQSLHVCPFTCFRPRHGGPSYEDGGEKGVRDVVVDSGRAGAFVHDPSDPFVLVPVATLEGGTAKNRKRK